MAATFSDSYDLVPVPSFRIKVQGAMITAAENIATESTTMSVDYWRLRRQLSASVLGAPNGWLDQFCWAVAVVTTITTASTDSDIQTAVDSVWASVAGAGPSP